MWEQTIKHRFQLAFEVESEQHCLYIVSHLFCYAKPFVVANKKMCMFC